ncbi:hypothetical protein [Intestinimonas butyriciproducens]|uniref:hypothetical protein n=1 Tax=Intestinimonas butyriciproducens TaxID=1297617 RepID=UPI003AF1B7E9
MVIRFVTEGDFLLPLLLPELAVSVLVHGGGIPHWKIGLNMFQIFSQLDHTTHSAAPVIDRAARPKNSLLQGM